LWPYEVDLAYGISGHFRQALATGRSALDELDKYYPRFERVTDSFGNWAGPGQMAPSERPIVRLGLQLTYQIEAWNPHDKPVTFTLKVDRPSGRTVTERTEDTTLQVTLEADDIDRMVEVQIWLHAPGSKRALDAMVYFQYRGIPE
jgi:hypothetical protein